MKTKSEASLLLAARSQLGTGERADGSSKFGSWYGRLVHNDMFDDQPWCQMFVSWCARQAGIPTSVIPNGASTVAVAEWFDDRRLLTQTPQSGDIVWFDWAGQHNVVGAIDHVGIVEAVRRDGTIVTIEGNTANKVFRRERARSCVATFGHWHRPDAPAKPTPRPTPVLTGTEALVKQLPILQPGAHGWHVKTVVNLLNARDFGVDPGVDDRILSPAIVGRLRAFQSAAGLPPTGVVNLATWAKLLRL